MAKSCAATVTFNISGDSFGGNGPLYTATKTNATGVVPSSVATSNGSTTVTIPAAATGVTIIPPPGSAVTKTLKGVAGDTGIVLDVANPIYLAFAAGANASLVITANGVETLELLWN